MLSTRQPTNPRQWTTQIFLVYVGVASAHLGLEGFLLPNGFVDGGATGISLLLRFLTDWPLAVWLPAVNLPFLVLGWRQVGRRFAVRSLVAITVLGLAASFIHYTPVTDDKLLTAVFGGFFLGLGIGLAVRGGAVIDGTEVLALVASKRTGLTIGDIILLINLAIFSAAALLLELEVALFSTITYLVASRTVNFVISGIEEYRGVMIISTESDNVRAAILEQLGRAVTIYHGEGGRTGEPRKILYCVITRFEIPALQRTVQGVDPKAFLVMHPVSDAIGGVVKKRLGNH